jgi:membrane protease subunit HflK
MATVEATSDFSRVFRHARTVGFWLICLLIVLYFASGLYSVKPEQRGVVKRFGQVITDNVPPGIHYHFPWPIESVIRLRTTEIRSMTVSFEETQPPPEGEKAPEITQAPETVPLLTADENLILAILLIQYTITEPENYLYTTANPDGLLNRIIQAETIDRAAGTGVEELLTTGRLELQTKLKQDIQSQVDAFDLGIRIVSVQIQKIGPPSEVAEAFRDVSSARADMYKLSQQARGDRNRMLPRARADADRVLREAEAYANESVERAKGDAHRFTAAWEEYRKSRTITAYRLYLEVIEEVLPKARKIFSSPEAERYIPPPITHMATELSPPVGSGKTQLGQPSSPSSGAGTEGRH